MNSIPYEIIEITGKDSKKFLNDYTTADINELNDSNSIKALCCNLKGRVIADVYLAKKDNETIYLCTHRSLEPLLFDFFKQYLPLFKISYLKVNLNCYATKTAEEIHPTFTLTPNLHLTFCEKKHSETEAMNIPISMDMNDIGIGLDMNKSDSNHLTFSELKTLLFENKSVFFTSILSNQYLPQELGFNKQGYISWSKGCFMGQSVLSRVEHVGKLKNALYSIEFEQLDAELITSLNSIFDSSHEKIGTIINHIILPNNKGIGILANLKNSSQPLVECYINNELFEVNNIQLVE